MIKKTISRTTFQEHLIDFVRDELAIEAIKDDGIYLTFKFDSDWDFMGSTKITLRYCKLDCDDKWLPVQRKIFYKTCPELGDTTLPYTSLGALGKAADGIKMDMVKKYNAIWSTIKVEPCRDYFIVSYEKAYVDNNDNTDYVTWNPAFDPLYVENTKRALRRIQENTYYGLYPRNAGLTYNFDEKLKEDIKTSLEGKWKPKADLDIHSPSKELLNRVYESNKKEEKEKTDMNVTLMVVPNGMNKDFVNKVKAYFQSNNSIRLFVASTDIGFSCPYGTTRTKYDLFEDWVKRGKVDIVYFMLGFEKDPDVRVFEAFVRGITEAEVPGKIDVRVVYQKDDIKNDIQHLRTAYFDEADAIEDLRNAGDKAIKEEKTMRDIYGLDDEGLEDIKNSKGQITASDVLVINDIMDMAFASDEDTKPAKKGGKK